jgi:glycosyltransferase involved in cell wall biosynthesis
MITILMAAYNGEQYIGEQIESILNQTEANWNLVIQDDCSSDATYQIACSYAQKYPGKIIAFRRDENSGSAANNFFSMLTYADGDYVMSCLR